MLAPRREAMKGAPITSSTVYRGGYYMDTGTWGVRLRARAAVHAWLRTRDSVFAWSVLRRLYTASLCY